MIFIPGNIPSSKNSKIATSKGVFMSKAVGRFLREIGIQSYSVSRKTAQFYKTKPCYFPIDEFNELMKYAPDNGPAIIGVHFVRATKAKFDFHNICQIIFDLLVALEIIDDDNMDCVIPMPFKLHGVWYSVDKDNPGAYVTLLNPKDNLPDKFLPKLF